MLGNLRNPPEPFGDVIRTHFRLKARPIMKQLDTWLTQDDGKTLEQDGALSAQMRHGKASGSSNAFRKDVADLKIILQKLIDGEDIPSGSTTTPDIPHTHVGDDEDLDEE